MQNEGNNFSDDYALAMSLQEFEFQNVSSNVPDVKKNVGSNIVDDKESQQTIGNDDYAIALRLQQIYDKERHTFGNDYEDVIPRMGNMSFEHREKERYSDKEKSPQKGTNYFGFDDAPPPYFSHQNPKYNNNAYSSQKPPYQPENNKPDYYPRSDYQSGYFPRSNSNNNFTSDNDNFMRYNNSDYSQNFTRNKSNISAQGVFKILLLGGTGTGKSTIINTMTNYFLGGTLDNPKIVIPSKYYKVTEREFVNEHSEAKIDDVTKSQTTKCHNYNFDHPDNPACKFTFIDSPGLSDTKGVKQDDMNIQEIINAAISAGSLSAIVIIANGTEARVTPSIKNTLVRLANNLPDELVDRNLLLILTKCAKSSSSFSEADFSREIAKPKQIFYMDNQAFCTDPQVWKKDEEEHHTVQFHWDKSIKTIDNLLKAITELSSTSTQVFVTMKNYRDDLKAKIVQVCQNIKNIQNVQQALDAAQKALHETGKEKNSFANYTQSQTVVNTKDVKLGHHNTVCTLHRKTIICHENCGLEFVGSTGNGQFKNCYCMGSNNKCRKCQCGPPSHYHTDVKSVDVTETISTILHDIKCRYDIASQQHNKHSSDANSYQSTLSTLQAAANSEYQQIHKLCHDLSKICSRFNFVDELRANIECMKQDARTLQNTNLRNNAEAEIKKIEQLANDLSSRRNRT
ncbi:hypothetical protein Glove_332g8 [Diversispora epigaea]|uniref:Uncharacterized protein n=1 Tax=Diversispora epigaea TaxID=1348612 RepID=A0A397HJ16_9GLOM|nr:hypothetical protein Glove_332g8 [Diversispora epigaea]